MWILRKAMTTMAILSPKKDVSNVEATLNGEPVDLKFDSANTLWTGDLSLKKKGMNVFIVTADTPSGQTQDVVVFYAAWDIMDHPKQEVITVEAREFLYLKFRVSDWDGFTDESVPMIYIDGKVVGRAIVQEDGFGPYYRYNYLVSDRVGSTFELEIKLDDGVTVGLWKVKIVKPVKKDGSIQ